LIWDYETGFEVDGSSAVIDGRVYVGTRRILLLLSLADGSLIYKNERLGSMEGSLAAVEGRIYVGTETGRSFTALI